MFRGIRFYLTRAFYRLLGINLNQRCKEIQELWDAGEEKRNQHLNDLLQERQPLDARGNRVDSLKALHNAPVMSKSVLRERSVAKAEKYSRHTAGTTGEPTYVKLNTSELSRMLGVREYCFKSHGLKLGMREARLWGRSAGGVKSRVRDFLLNRRVFHPVGPSAEKEVIEMLSWKPDYIYGYSSLILEAAQMIERGKLEPLSIKGVICTAENILPSQKRLVSKVFNCPVMEEYGATEFDVIAFDCPIGHRHLVNPWLVVESMDHEMVISDVSREAQAFVRYRIGDIADVTCADCYQLGSNILVENLEGRAFNRFAYGNDKTRFHAVEFSRVMDAYMQEFGETLSFSFVQRKPGFVTVTTNPEAGNPSDLCRFVETQIYKRCKTSIRVEWSGQNSDSGVAFRAAKSSYFVQAMDHCNVSESDSINHGYEV